MASSSPTAWRRAPRCVSSAPLPWARRFEEIHLAAQLPQVLGELFQTCCRGRSAKDHLQPLGILDLRDPLGDSRRRCAKASRQDKQDILLTRLYNPPLNPPLDQLLSDARAHEALHHSIQFAFREEPVA